MIEKINGLSIDLVKIQKEDIETLRIWRNSKSISDNMLNQNFISIEDQNNWFEKINKEKNGSYWIIKLKNGEKIGFASLSNINYSVYTAEPGLYIGDSRYRNSLYGIEAYYFLLNYGFGELKLLNIYGIILPHNIPAIKMNKQFGFESINKIFNASQFNIEIKLKKNDFYKSKIAQFYKKYKN